MFEIIGYIIFIIITAAACGGAAIAGTITGMKQNDLSEEDQNK